MSATKKIGVGITYPWEPYVKAVNTTATVLVLLSPLILAVVLSKVVGRP